MVDGLEPARFETINYQPQTINQPSTHLELRHLDELDEGKLEEGVQAGYGEGAQEELLRTQLGGGLEAEGFQLLEAVRRQGGHPDLDDDAVGVHLGHPVPVKGAARPLLLQEGGEVLERGREL